MDSPVTGVAQALGFRWSPCAFSTEHRPNRARACFRVRKALEGFVHDAVALEGNPFTLPEVKTLLEGITVGGRRLADERQVLHQAESWRLLLRMLKSGEFAFDAPTACALHNWVGREEALEWGVFRDGRVTIAGTTQLPTNHAELPQVFERGAAALRKIRGAHERGIATYLFFALHQFFWDGNKRTGRLMMNGILLDAGYDAITVPVAKRQAFNESMVRFYDTKDGTEMMGFMASCSLDHRLRLDVVEDAPTTSDSFDSDSFDHIGP